MKRLIFFVGLFFLSLNAAERHLVPYAFDKTCFTDKGLADAHRARVADVQSAVDDLLKENGSHKVAQALVKEQRRLEVLSPEAQIFEGEDQERVRAIIEAVTGVLNGKADRETPSEMAVMHLALNYLKQHGVKFGAFHAKTGQGLEPFVEANGDSSDEGVLHILPGLFAFDFLKKMLERKE